MRSRQATHRFTRLPLTQAALGFATARHIDQYRDSDRAPFIEHPIEVAQLLHRYGHPDHVIAAGLLHDVLENTTTTRAELERRFGPRIARLVSTVSDDPSIEDYVSRKHQLRERVAHADPDALTIFAADKIAKVRELAWLPASERTGRRVHPKLSHYRASLQTLRLAAGANPLVDHLEAELSRLVATDADDHPSQTAPVSALRARTPARW
jgi:(p)ppGpp synthase/HD superfamily hydrolase